MTKSNGFILWEGDSLLDGSPIVAIAVGTSTRSTNSKTGGMLQTYIIRTDMKPGEAIRAGLDASICGDCVHRGDGHGKARTCYVQMTGPSSVWRCYVSGGYPQATSLEEVGQGREVRLGTYGDPAAVPAYVWEHLIAWSTGHTGYTHQWRESSALMHICMASADNEEQAIEAQAMGWRTFRVAADDKQLPGEVLCPASEKAGRKLTCEQCLACCGAGSKRKGSIVIPIHGGTAVMASVEKLADRIIARG